MGATNYLIKPLSAHSLSRAVASVLHEKSNQFREAQEEASCGCGVSVKGLLKPDAPSATVK